MPGESLLSPSDHELISTIARRVRKERVEVIRATAIRLEEARLEARRLAADIAALDGIRRVIHFGSSATGRSFRLDSDIDIAIAGGDLFAAMGVAETSRFHVDVVDIETLPSSLREAILSEGVVLHECA